MIEIIEWNRERNDLAFDPRLEVKMLSEEAREFFTAPNVVERLREYADFMFVWTGTQAKYFARKCVSPLELHSKDFQELREWAENTKEFMEDVLRGELNYPPNFYKILNEALKAVTAANQAKGTEKDAFGKIKKGPNYISPTETIQKLLEELCA